VELTPTSYAILALLDDRPWSAYELARHWEKSVLTLLLPRARSNVFREPKRLEKGGLVTSMTEPSPSLFGRTRTRYSITDAGREALASWQDGESDEAFNFESESLLRLTLCNSDDPALLSGVVDAVGRQVHARRQTRQDAMTADGIDAHSAPWRLLQIMDEALLAWCTEMEQHPLLNEKR